MSAGQFESAFYTLNNAGVARMRVQPETKALTVGGVANASAAGPATLPTRARTSGSRRSLGIHARLVRVKFTGAPPDGYTEDGVIALPWFNPTTWAAIGEGDTGSYLGAAIEVVGTTPEKVR